MLCSEISCPYPAPRQWSTATEETSDHQYTGVSVKTNTICLGEGKGKTDFEQWQKSKIEKKKKET